MRFALHNALLELESCLVWNTEKQGEGKISVKLV